jgi:tRNA A-37 threonylcarbamoyl transferase component Bud32
MLQAENLHHNPVIFLLAEAGWVHRDLSPSNVYEYEGRLIIGDLEYAKCRDRDDGRDHDVRIVSLLSS